MLVDNKAEQFRTEIDNLLEGMGSRRIFSDCATKQDRSAARQLIIELVLLASASFCFRILAVTTTWPLKLLHLVSKPADEPCSLKHAVATELLRTPDCCLKTTRPYLHTGISDLAWKLKSTHGDELATCAQSHGKVPLRLYSMLLIWRSQLSFESKSMEGVHVALQQLARIAPRMGHALASDRLQLKLGSPISPSECCDFYNPAQLNIAETDSIGRFAPPSLDTTAPAIAMPYQCEHNNPAAAYQVLGYLLPVQRLLPVGAKKAYISLALCLAKVLQISLANVCSWLHGPTSMRSTSPSSGSMGCLASWQRSYLVYLPNIQH